jgi:polyphosphate kinase 2
MSKKITTEELEEINSKEGLLHLMRSKEINVKKLLKTLDYEAELEQLQIELLNLQGWAVTQGKRIAILFEGRDAAGKGGTIRRFTEHLNPRSLRVVALPKPTKEEKGQWYFQRYIKQLPNPGELVFFDRSWYNRAVVEPVNDFCTEKQYRLFLEQVIDFERMIQESGVILIKFWLDTTKEEQAERFEARKNSPLKRWKFSPVDEKAQEYWDLYTKYRDAMFEHTHTKQNPWVIVQADNKKKARIGAIKYVLEGIDYDGKGTTGVALEPSSKTVQKYHAK